MKVRFLADADLNRAIVRGVLRRVDSLTAKSGRITRHARFEVLTLAAERQRVLVSHDAGTMQAHFHAFRNAGKHNSGVFLIHQSLDAGTAAEELLLIWEASEWENRLEWLPLRSG